RALLLAAPNGPASAADPTTIFADVTQHHNHASRDGLYLDPLFTQTAAANLTRDLNFNGTISGNVYAQPLYIENGPGGAAMVIAVTQSDNVYALNAATGAVIWQRSVGTAVTSGLPCGNINPVGITNTPAVDLTSRALFFDAEVVSGTPKHMIFSLNVDTGATNAGWPVDVNAVVTGFDTSQSSRAAVGIVGNTVYVPYGGRFGDCGGYHGRLVGVQMSNPASVMAWSTVIGRAGVWGPGGVASDGTDTFVVTGNGNSTGTWSGSEAVIRLQPGPIFSGSTIDYWAPTNWQSTDGGDPDLVGGGANELMAGTRSFNTGIAARGRIYYATDNKVYAFSVPTSSTPTPTATATATAAPTATATATATVTATATGVPSATPTGTTQP